MNTPHFQHLFMDEAMDICSNMESALLVWHSGDPEDALIQDIFRGLHTIKGSASMVGMDQMAGFAHRCESFFEGVRSGGIALTPIIIDTVLRMIDAIREFIHGRTPDTHELFALLDSMGTPAEPVKTPVILQPSSPAPTGMPAGTPEGTESVWRIRFKPHKDVFFRGVRLEPLFKELKSLGDARIQAHTELIPAWSDLDPTLAYTYWTILLSTRAPKLSIQDVFIFVEDYAEITITELTSGDMADGISVPRIGEVMIKQGSLDPKTATEIHDTQIPFGEWAVSQGKVNREQVHAALAEQALIRETTQKRVSSQEKNTKESASLRVSKDKLDDLLNQISELVVMQAALEQEARQVGRPGLTVVAETLSRLVDDLRNTTMRIRMVALEETFQGFQRMVRDLAKQLGKEVQLDISGGATELDKNVIELLKDPLIHIIRNALDHGIEPPDVRTTAGKPAKASLEIGARQIGNRVEVFVKDDGRGLDAQRIRAKALERNISFPPDATDEDLYQLIFAPGFSTSEMASDVSGRGVGMDVVKRNIEKLRGEIHLDSIPQKGLTVRMSIPLTLVIIEGLLVRCGDVDYIINLTNVRECVDTVWHENMDHQVVLVRNQTIPLVHLGKIMGLRSQGQDLSRVVIVQHENQAIGILVDRVVGRMQVVIKPLSNHLKHIKLVSGASILGDGTVALIIDIHELIKESIKKAG